MFGRRGKSESDETSEVESTPEVEETQTADTASQPGYPRDITAADPSRERVDLGALQLPAMDEIGIDLQVDPNGNVAAVTVMLGASAVQLAVFAASRSEKMWDQVRKELRGNIGGSGGLVDEISGEFGPELRANLPAQLPDGKTVMQPTRFLGFDGPRWFLRVTVQGAFTTPDGDPRVPELLGGLVVDRGTQAMAPGDALALRLPNQVVAQGIPERPPLAPFARGPEITEIR